MIFLLLILQIQIEINGEIIGESNNVMINTTVPRVIIAEFTPELIFSQGFE